MVKRNETLFRASMGFNTLGFILAVKLANPNVTEIKPEKTPLNSAKSETWEYNKRHSSSSSSITTKNVEKKMMSLFFFYLYIFYLYIFCCCCKHDEGSGKKQISRFFIMSGG